MLISDKRDEKIFKETVVSKGCRQDIKIDKRKLQSAFWNMCIYNVGVNVFGKQGCYKTAIKEHLQKVFLPWNHNQKAIESA